MQWTRADKMRDTTQTLKERAKKEHDVMIKESFLESQDLASSLELADSQKNTQSKAKLIIIPYGVLEESPAASEGVDSPLTIALGLKKLSVSFKEEYHNDINN